MNPNPRTPECQEGSPGKGTGCQALLPLPLGSLEAASSQRGWQYWPLGASQVPGSFRGPVESAWADNPDSHPTASSCPAATVARCRQTSATWEVSQVGLRAARS